MATRIPRRIVDNRPQPFQPGVYMGELTEVQEQWSDDKKNLELVMIFTNNTAVDGDWDPGNRRFYQRANIIRDGMSMVDVEAFDDNVHYALQRAASLLGQMAVAVGAANVENGDVLVEWDSFLENLQNGMFKGKKVLYQVYHRTYKRREDPAERAKWTGIAPEIGTISSPNTDETVRER